MVDTYRGMLAFLQCKAPRAGFFTFNLRPYSHHFHVAAQWATCFEEMMMV